MPVDPLSPDTLTLAQAARLLPSLRAGRPVDPSTLWRWASRGLHGVRLPIVRVGGTACTSREALRKFLADVEAARQKAVAPPPAPVQRPPAADRAADELAAFGI
jgi:hypothetical protein